MREEQEKLDDSSRISFDEPNPLDSSKQPLLNESSEKTWTGASSPAVQSGAVITVLFVF